MHQKLQKGAIPKNDANMLINATKKVKGHDRVMVGEACRGPLSSEARVSRLPSSPDSLPRFPPQQLAELGEGCKGPVACDGIQK